MNAQDIDAIVAAVRAGDRERYRLVFDALYRRVRIVVSLRSQDQGLVDEVVQDAFVTAYEKLAAYRLQGTFAAWLTGIALNLLARRQRELRLLRPADGLELLLQSSPPVQEDAHAERLADRVAICLARLPAAARELVHLRFSEGLAVQDLAQRLGRTAVSVSVSIHRLRSALRICLQNGTGDV